MDRLHNRQNFQKVRNSTIHTNIKEHPKVSKIAEIVYQAIGALFVLFCSNIELQYDFISQNFSFYTVL
jgi:hypothetical protein